MGKMYVRILGVALCGAALTVCAGAQTAPATNVMNNNDGVANVVPLYNGTATLEIGSLITQSSSKIGIGTATPVQELDISNAGVDSANLQFDYAPQPTVYFHDIANSFSSSGGTLEIHSEG